MQPDNPSYKCRAYNEQVADCELVNDVFAGTRQLKAKGTRYLPQHPAEKDKAYSVRLNQSNFWNAYKRSIQGLTGMVFRKNPVLGDDVPAIIKTHAENIDLAGSHLDVFAKELFKAALIDGHAFILIDMPPAVTTRKPNATLVDEAGRRPYWLMVRKNQVINWRTQRTTEGRDRLIQATIEECVYEPDGIYTEKEVKQYRVLRPGSWEIYRKAQDKDEIVLWDSGSTSPLTEIPLVPIYTNRTGFFCSAPPLLDLAYENLRHYRLQSDLDHILHVANVPIGYAAGRTVKKDAQGNPVPLEIGPNSFVDLEKDGKIGYAEHQGSAIGKAQEEIDKTKANMATLGLLLLAKQPQAQKTATETVIDYEAESSELAGMVRSEQDGLEAALAFSAQFANQSEGGSIALNKNFTKRKLDTQEILAYAAMVAAGDMELDLMYMKLEQAEEIPDGYDWKAAVERLKKEKTADNLAFIDAARKRIAERIDNQSDLVS
jgi:hypothetical protein